MTLGERTEHLEVEGYVVIPGVLSPERLDRLKHETAQLETRRVSYSENQQVGNGVQWSGGAITELIAHPPTIEFLKTLFGHTVVLMAYDYSCARPGHPGISLHSDSQPWGSNIFGQEFTCPKLVRCLYYLQDLTPEVSPFRVVPHSHLSFHNDANPYLRYESHPEEVVITCRAGDMVMINQNVFHGNHANVSDHSREALLLAYRPTWASPSGEVDEWDRTEIAKVAEDVRAVMGSRNQRIWAYEAPDKPDNMPTAAPGINPSRWQRDDQQV